MKAFVQALRLETRLCRGTYQTGYALLRVCAGAVVGRRCSFSFLVRSFAINTKKNLVPGWRHRSVLFTHVNRLHGPPKESKLLRRDGLKGLQPYIRAVGAVVAAAHDGYSRLGFLSLGCTQGTGDSSEFPNPV